MVGSLAIIVLSFFNVDFICSIIAIRQSAQWCGCTPFVGGGGASSFLYACQTLRGFEGVKRQCEHVASSSLVCLHGIFLISCFEAQNISHMFTIVSDASHFSFLPIHCFASTMKVAPSILQKPSTKSGSLYFYRGVRLRPGSSDAEAAEVYYRRVVVARAMTRKLSMDWTPHSPPCVLKSKWARKWDSLNNVWTPHQRVDMNLAKKIWHLNIWKWQAKRIAGGTSLIAAFKESLMVTR
jgi:hypothetical protein